MFFPDILLLTLIKPLFVVVWFDALFIVYYYYLNNYILHFKLFGIVWWPGMKINVSVQYNGEFRVYL